MLVPVILAGGSGTRLWPVSRASYPKQFCKIFGEHSLFQQTVLRACAIPDVAAPLIVTNEQYYFLCEEQLKEIDCLDAHYLLEPCPRNTAPAIALAAHYLPADAMMLVMPSDHLIKDDEKFATTIAAAITPAEQGHLMVFGIQPTAPKTGYGYIQKGANESGVTTVMQFVEKPTQVVADRYLASGDYYWNSGIFLFKATVFLSELAQLSPDISQQVDAASQTVVKKSNYSRVDYDAFSACRDDSIDYAMMEKTQRGALIPFSGAWSDLGSWTAVGESLETDAHNNVIHGDVMARDTQGCVINAGTQLVTTIGLTDTIVVATDDAILVADKQYAESIKETVAALKERSDNVASEHKKVNRPWGAYTQLAMSEGYQVKHLVVKPGASLSLQLHYHRSEHWVVVSGIAQVTVGARIFELLENQSVYIEKETKHRLSNNTDQSLHIIEVQCGHYLGEDDIVRFDDVYDRSILTH